MQSVAKVRQLRTIALFEHPREFLAMLDYAIARFARRCNGKRAPLVRLNVLSDIQWEIVAPWLFERHPTVQFYDYTKIPGRVVPSNYHLTFSHDGRNWADCVRELAAGRNVAAVFDTKRGSSLPDAFRGVPVVDGDVSDLRPYDPRGVVVGLRYKRAEGVTVDDAGEFVIRVTTANPVPDTDPAFA